MSTLQALMISQPLIPLIRFFRRFTVVSKVVCSLVIHATNLIDILEPHAVMPLQDHIIALSTFRWSQVVSRAVDILSTDLLVIHGDEVSIIAADVSLLVIISTTDEFVTAIWATGPFFCLVPGAPGPVVAVDAGEFFWSFVVASGLIGVHAEWLVDVVHILWSSEILQYICNVVVTVSACIRATSSQSCLVMDSMRTLNSMISHTAARTYQVQTQFTWFNIFHANPTWSTNLVLSRHDGLAVDAVWIRFSVVCSLHCVVTIVLIVGELILGWVCILIKRKWKLIFI